MKIIPPYQITSEILNLIHEAKEYLVLVSPYVNFSNWQRIENDIINARKRGVNVQFYTRLDNENSKSWEQIEKLEITPKLVKNLHAKVYFNEQTGIVTSMNLLTSSNLNAIEFGSIYHTQQELSELKEFVKKHLEPNVHAEKPNEEDLYLAKEKFQILLSNFLSNALNTRVMTRWRNGRLEFNAYNQFYLTVDHGNNRVEVGGICSTVDVENFEEFKANCEIEGFEICVGNMVIYMTSAFKLSNSNLNFLLVKEKKTLLHSTAQFVDNLLQFKDYCYQHKRK